MNNLAAVIVETRPLYNLQQIIEDHLSFLPEYTNPYVFGSDKVDILLSQSNFAYNFVNVGTNMNEAEYNKLLTSSRFWELIDEENILIFQHDSAILRTGIEDYYKWDYIGAPWKFSRIGGNGGFSFRHKSAMLDVIKKTPEYNQTSHGNEDVFFSNSLNKLGYKMPTQEESTNFSVETIFSLGSFGCHAINKYHSIADCDKILNQYKL